MSTIDLRITSKALNKAKLTLEEFIVLYSYYCKVDTKKELESLLEKGYVVTPDLFSENKEYNISSAGVGRIEQVFAVSSSKVDDKRLENLAKKMREIFPKGKKPCTNYYWSDGWQIISDRLSMFFGKFGDEFTDEQILAATQEYVNAMEFKPDMRLLKYFIIKNDTDISGESITVSDLLTYIQNLDEEEQQQQDWTSKLK